MKRKPDQDLTPAELKQWLHDGQEIALIDVREAGEYGENHLFYAVNVPYSRLELDVVNLAPNPAVRLVVVDEDGGHLSQIALKRLASLGYKNLHRLSGGVAAWQQSGRQLFAGVNVPSKAFGELAEHFFNTPHISAPALAEKQKKGEPLIVVDGRPFAEYQKMNIPGAVSCPNGELALRIDDLVKDENTTIVINCAGRTRSIIGAQTLINLGVKNPIFALENGTQGWYLADLPLEHGATRRWGSLEIPGTVAQRRAQAASLAASYGIQSIERGLLEQWQQDPSRTTFLCDVRNPEEYAQGHLPGAVSTPGGQLIQATDQYVAVRGARLVLCDADGVRAPVVAHWLKQMGWEIYLLDGPASVNDMTATASANRRPKGLAQVMALDQLAPYIKAGATLIDIRPSARYRDKHIKGAFWRTRRDVGNLVSAQSAEKPFVVIVDEEAVGHLAATDLMEYGARQIFVCTGLTAKSEVPSLVMEATPNEPPDTARVDFLFFVHDRHDGNKAAARQYLAWELNLLSQIDESEQSAFKLAKPNLH